MENKIHTKTTEAKQHPTESIASADDCGYNGTPQSVVAPVFELARRLRFRVRSADQIIRRTKTQLDHAIVSALIEAAARLLPPDNTADGVRARVEKDTRRAERANCAEAAFLREFTRQGYHFLSEVQQKQQLMSVTPDIRFQEPYLICGHLCWWLEFKDFFGFRANPFVAKQNSKQLSKYAAQIGPGAVVYELGFETDHVNIEGVKSFRKEEVVKSLTWEGRGENGAYSVGFAGTSSKSTVESSKGEAEASLSKLERKGQGRINGQHNSRQRTRRLKKIRTRLQRTANAASVETRGPKDRQELLN